MTLAEIFEKAAAAAQDTQRTEFPWTTTGNHNADWTMVEIAHPTKGKKAVQTSWLKANAINSPDGLSFKFASSGNQAVWV